MRYFHFVYDRMAEAGDALLDEHGRARPSAVAALARESTGLDTGENLRRLDALDRAYRRWAAGTPTSPTSWPSAASASSTRRGPTSRTSRC